jgi:hypothetical protein
MSWSGFRWLREVVQIATSASLTRPGPRAGFEPRLPAHLGFCLLVWLYGPSIQWSNRSPCTDSPIWIFSFQFYSLEQFSRFSWHGGSVATSSATRGAQPQKITAQKIPPKITVAGVREAPGISDLYWIGHSQFQPGYRASSTRHGHDPFQTAWKEGSEPIRYKCFNKHLSARLISCIGRHTRHSDKYK